MRRTLLAVIEAALVVMIAVAIIDTLGVDIDLESFFEEVIDRIKIILRAGIKIFSEMIK